MAQIIMMAEHYRKRPSEILNIDDDYVAFCFDEAAFFLSDKAFDSEKGKYDWTRIRWKQERPKNNQGFINSLKKGVR